MKEEMFISLEELEEIELTGEYTIEDNGMSGQYNGFHWYTLTKDESQEQFEVYVK